MIDAERFTRNVFRAIHVQDKVRLDVAPTERQYRSLLFLFNKFTNSMGNLEDLTLTEFLLPVIQNEREAVFAALHVGNVIAIQMAVCGTNKVHIHYTSNADSLALTVNFEIEGLADVKCHERHVYQAEVQDSFEKMFEALTI